MPKKVPSQFTGRFSIKPKKISPKSKTVASASSSQEPEPAQSSASGPAPEVAPLIEKFRDEPTPFHERKRKLSGESEPEEGTMLGLEGCRESLAIYSQQLEVQPPLKGRKHQITEQSEMQVEQAAILGESERTSDQRAPLRQPHTSQSPREPHHHPEEAIAILKAGWQGRNGAQPDIKGTAKALASRVSNAPDADIRLSVRHIVQAMHEYAYEHPRAIDFMLLAFSEAIKLLPDSFLDQHGHGPEATLTQLKWLLIDGVNGFDGFLLRDSQGVIDPEDLSNLKFEDSHVSGKDIMEMLHQINHWRFQRQAWLMAAAAQSRCFALEILRKKNGEHIESLIDAGLNRRSAQWCKANMVGACILLRGCAKSLNAAVPTSGIKVFAWKASLDKFLLQDEETGNNDFVVKAHAAVEIPSSYVTCCHNSTLI